MNPSSSGYTAAHAAVQLTALRRSEERLRQAVSAAGVVPYQLDYCTNTYTLMGTGIFEMTGYLASEMSSELWRSLVQEYHLMGAFTGMSIGEAKPLARADTAMDWKADYKIRTRSGETRWLHDSAVQVLDEDGHSVGAIGILQDITERKVMEAQYRSIFENAVEGIFQTTPDGRFLTVNPAQARMYGYESPAELLATVTDLEHQFYVAPNRRAEFKRALGASDMVHGFESQVYRKDGSIVWISENARAVRGPDGAVQYYEGTVEDITARRRAEAALRESEERLNFALEVSHTGAWELDLQDQTAQRTLIHDRIFGYATLLPSWTYPMFLEHVLPEDRAEVDRRFRQSMATQTHWSFECRIRRTDGEVRWIWSAGGHERDSAGKSVRMSGIVQDITERKRAEEELRETNQRLEAALNNLQRAQSKVAEQERLRALGEMASGIAHDFNNALAPILGFSELLLMQPEKLDDHARLLRLLEMINTGAKDAGSIVGRLREFYRAREESEVLVPVNLNTLVEQVISLTQPRWKDQAMAAGKTVSLVSELGVIVDVDGNPQELRELLTNLIFNAVDSLQAHGEIRLRTAQAEGRVILEVRDNGAGMSTEVRQRCLEPFFTTKGERGTGLGLAMVHGIMRRHDGELEIDSKPGAGTTVRLGFPIPRVTVASRLDPAFAPGRPLHILVVDDEPFIREVLVDYLTGDGHTADTAANGREAIEKFHTGRFDLVLTDRAMPEMNGDQLAAYIHEAAPGKPVIMLTGFGDLMNSIGERPVGVTLIIGKPATITALRAAIANCGMGSADF